MYIQAREGLVRVKDIRNEELVTPEDHMHTDKAFKELEKKAKILDQIIETVWTEETSKFSHKRLATIVRHLVKPYIDANKEAVIELKREYERLN